MKYIFDLVKNQMTSVDTLQEVMLSEHYLYTGCVNIYYHPECSYILCLRVCDHFIIREGFNMGKSSTFF